MKQVKRFLKWVYTLILMLVFILSVCAADSLMESDMFWILCIGVFSPFFFGWLGCKLFNLNELWEEN